MSAPPKLNFSKSPRSGTGIVLPAFLIIAAFFLITEHTAHLFGVLPYALLLLSLLLFLFIRREQNGNRVPGGDHPEDRQ
ncbi:MAG: DUF2933 domain-containing protein [Anaerolineales bacterium]|nr:DUF2933 domain-containing protein [Anaerolineales bacterium]